MKLERTIKIDEHELLVAFSYLGFEKYILDGVLIHRAWDFRFRGKRKLKVGDKELVIDLSVAPGDYYCRAYLDGELYIEELFPEFRERAKANRRLSIKDKMWLLACLLACLVVCWLTILGLAFYQYQRSS